MTGFCLRACVCVCVINNHTSLEQPFRILSGVTTASISAQHIPGSWPYHPDEEFRIRIQQEF